MEPQLWRHQQEAFDFARVRRATLLNLGLGTGKTLVAIELAKQWESQRILVVSPLSVTNVWRDQLAQWVDESEYTAAVLNKGTAAKKLKQYKSAELVRQARAVPMYLVVNYEFLRTPAMQQAVRAWAPDLVIADECHRLKSPFGKTSKAVALIARDAAHRLGLSGTICPHSPLDAFGSFRFLDASIFGHSFVSFRKKFAVLGGWQNKEVLSFQNQDEMRERMARITIQVGREVLDLPPAVHETIAVELEPKARKAYQALETQIQAQIEDGTVTVSNGLVQLLRLQEATSGSVRGDDGCMRVVSTAKRNALRELLEAAGGEPVVVFGRFRQDLDTVHAVASELGIESCELSGRRHELDAWKGSIQVIAVQIQAGGIGVDLTRARICCYLSTGFSLGDFDQSLARVHRPGQNQSVVYYHIVARGTVDEKVRGALFAKRNVIKAILEDLAGARHGSEPSTQLRGALRRGAGDEGAAEGVAGEEGWPESAFDGQHG